LLHVNESNTDLSYWYADTDLLVAKT
jgi:hypothetical protein